MYLQVEKYGFSFHYCEATCIDSSYEFPSSLFHHPHTYLKAALYPSAPLPRPGPFLCLIAVQLSYLGNPIDIYLIISFPIRKLLEGGMGDLVNIQAMHMQTWGYPKRYLISTYW